MKNFNIRCRPSFHVMLRPFSYTYFNHHSTALWLHRRRQSIEIFLYLSSRFFLQSTFIFSSFYSYLRAFRTLTIFLAFLSNFHLKIFLLILNTFLFCFFYSIWHFIRLIFTLAVLFHFCCSISSVFFLCFFFFIPSSFLLEFRHFCWNFVVIKFWSEFFIVFRHF